MRGTGETAKRMETAPKDSIYVWANNRLDYPKILAQRNGAFAGTGATRLFGRGYCR